VIELGAIGVALEAIRELVVSKRNAQASVLLDKLIVHLGGEPLPPADARGPSRWHATKLRFRAFERDGWTCSYCGTAINAHTGHADHVVPRSRGGPDALQNLATACRPCNLSKGARTPAEWRS
jgi:hypothetical protein